MSDHDKSLYFAKEPTNASVAARIGLTNAGVSRIRRGNRHPSVTIMRNIEREYDFPMVDQYAAMHTKRYAIEFEKALQSDLAKSASSKRR